MILNHDQSTVCPVCSSTTRYAYVRPDGIIRRCPVCSHCFSDLKTLKPETYSEDYFSETHKNWFQNPNLELFKCLRKFITPYGRRARILDVGCGQGHFLSYLQKAELSLQLTGIDLAALPASGAIRYIQRDIYAVDLPETFDVIVSLAVIEHVPDIQKFVDKLKAFGHPGSTIVIMTLNEDGLIYAAAKILKALGFTATFNRLYSNHHLHHYTLRSLRALIERAGLSAVSHRTHNFPLAAVDFPATNPWVDAIRVCGVAILFLLGRLTNRSFLQTIVCKL